MTFGNYNAKLKFSKIRKSQCTPLYTAISYQEQYVNMAGKF